MATLHQMSLFSYSPYLPPPSPPVGEDILIEDIPAFIVPPGATRVTDAIAFVRDDILFERDETFIVEIVSVSSGVIGERSTAQVTIFDNDRKHTVLRASVFIYLIIKPFGI